MTHLKSFKLRELNLLDSKSKDFPKKKDSVQNQDRILPVPHKVLRKVMNRLGISMHQEASEYKHGFWAMLKYHKGTLHAEEGPTHEYVSEPIHFLPIMPKSSATEIMEWEVLAPTAELAKLAYKFVYATMVEMLTEYVNNAPVAELNQKTGIPEYAGLLHKITTLSAFSPSELEDEVNATYKWLHENNYSVIGSQYISSMHQTEATTNGAEFTAIITYVQNP